jgi:hypothetical protein
MKNPTQKVLKPTTQKPQQLSAVQQIEALKTGKGAVGKPVSISV